MQIGFMESALIVSAPEGEFRSSGKVCSLCQEFSAIRATDFLGVSWYFYVDPFHSFKPSSYPARKSSLAAGALFRVEIPAPAYLLFRTGSVSRFVPL